MLKKPDVETENILRLADLIEALNSNQFSVYRWERDAECGTSRCIAGWALHMVGQPIHLEGAGISDRAAKVLGLSSAQIESLFFFDAIHVNPSPKQAARVLRHLAVTGEVDWSKAS